MPDIYCPFSIPLVTFWLLSEVDVIVISATGPSPDIANGTEKVLGVMNMSRAH
jgi:hypothetical protein